jgi:amino acid adenylation domain-containing protein
MHNASDEEPSQIYSAGIVQNMTWFARKTDAGLVIFLEYRADLYERSTVERLASHFLAVLRDAVRDPSRRIDALSLLSPAERVAVTETFNATGADLDAAPVTLQFERQAARTPNAIAVRAPGTRATYAALNRRANQLARHLRDQGVGPGMLVGICLDRSVDLVASLLGVLKTGAAYVPLDPGFPAARLDYMAEHSGLALVVVDSGSQTGRGWAVRRVDLGADAAAIEAQDGHDLGLVPGAGDPAYVIYTSGSTGRPNGVVVPHGALSNFLGAMLRAPGIGQDDVLAAVTTVSFDIAGLELYVPLIAGACVVLVPRAVATDGPNLANLLAEERITVMQATPATWRLLLESGWRAPAGFVALCGGEALPEDLARSLHARVDALWNMYGPTETTIWSTAGRIETGSGTVSIGRPIANTRVYIVDGSGRPVPIGVAGEIWIGGAGVASGYRGNPELTAEKFVADPFVGGAARVYRTGDLGRWLPDGRLAHMGRLDQQVKLRGFRIEPGEIEAALAAHEAVREAVVLLRGDDPDVQRLVAYVLYRPGHDLTTSEARRHLQALLPDYMIPSLFVAVDAIPRTPNGKVDRRALPDPVGAGGSAAGGYVEPATAAERLIARVWADTLKIERVGAEDNFFDLGGHSLLALRVAAAVEAETGWRMAPFVLFGQTLSQVAASLQAREAGTAVAT